ncbi:hypothetical protein FU659_34225, partial [Paenibacillus sp. N3.4]
MAIALLCAGIVGCVPMNLNASASTVSFIAVKPKHEIAIPVLSYHSIGAEPVEQLIIPLILSFSLAVSTFSVLTASLTGHLAFRNAEISFTAHHSAHSLIFFSCKHGFR